MKQELLLPDYGTLFTLEEFIDMCGKGYFIDYDGSGYYSDGRVYWADEYVAPSDLVCGRIKYNQNFRYVLWFNK